jgi:hypothetical protein
VNCASVSGVTLNSDFFDQPLGQELGHDLAGGAAGQFRRGFKGTVVAL